MRKSKRFTFRVSDEELKLISDLADKLQRSDADAVRVIILAAAQDLSLIDELKLRVEERYGSEQTCRV